MATVAEFCDSRTFLRHCGQAFTVTGRSAKYSCSLQIALQDILTAVGPDLPNIVKFALRFHKIDRKSVVRSALV